MRTRNKTRKQRSRNRKTKRTYRHKMRRIQRGGWGMRVPEPKQKQNISMMHGGWGGQEMIPI